MRKLKCENVEIKDQGIEQRQCGFREHTFNHYAMPPLNIKPPTKEQSINRENNEMEICLESSLAQ